MIFNTTQNFAMEIIFKGKCTKLAKLTLEFLLLKRGFIQLVTKRKKKRHYEAHNDDLIIAERYAIITKGCYRYWYIRHNLRVPLY